jgi:hypothetical protein
MRTASTALRNNFTSYSTRKDWVVFVCVLPRGGLIHVTCVSVTVILGTELHCVHCRLDAVRMSMATFRADGDELPFSVVARNVLIMRVTFRGRQCIYRKEDTLIE